ncbi:putative sugar nucleotidyl transferase [Hugenholtzia roseola]|uniref:putative sugar nucleotidyl transferase n=1 Tax=Hugenholtzia roseola TaxID=1002 RepID=UPI00041FF075|nr:putative sugar nucleotidyl transferase [Hugenholtzia roseola]
MPHYIFFDAPILRKAFLPLTYTRSLASLTVGILPIRKKWQLRLPNSSFSCLTENYLRSHYPLEFAQDQLYLLGNLLPTFELLEAIKTLRIGQKLMCGENLLAFRSAAQISNLEEIYPAAQNLSPIYIENYDALDAWQDIFLKNRAQIYQDFDLLTQNRKSQPIEDPHTILYGNPADLFIEEGADIKTAVLNLEKGRIYIGKGATIEEGCLIRGALALGEGAVLNTGAKLRGDNSIGRFCKIGGEVSNSVIFDYTNKAHDGFLGNSVIGSWCNLGANTNNSNLKNNYSKVSVWSYLYEMLVPTELQFCGLLMGDYSKSGINTMFNTGTTVGVGANVFGSGFPPKFIPSFSWGGGEGFDTALLSETFKAAERMQARRGVAFTQADSDMLRAIFQESQQYRAWEK